MVLIVKHYLQTKQLFFGIDNQYVAFSSTSAPKLDGYINGEYIARITIRSDRPVESNSNLCCPEYQGYKTFQDGLLIQARSSCGQGVASFSWRNCSVSDGRSLVLNSASQVFKVPSNRINDEIWCEAQLVSGEKNLIFVVHWSPNDLRDRLPRDVPSNLAPPEYYPGYWKWTGIVWLDIILETISIAIVSVLSYVTITSLTNVLLGLVAAGVISALGGVTVIIIYVIWIVLGGVTLGWIPFILYKVCYWIYCKCYIMKAKSDMGHKLTEYNSLKMKESKSPEESKRMSDLSDEIGKLNLEIKKKIPKIY